jgi:hypothetical protein
MAHRLTYRTVEHILSSVSTLFDVTLQSIRIERLQELEAAQKIA